MLGHPAHAKIVSDPIKWLKGKRVSARINHFAKTFRHLHAVSCLPGQYMRPFAVLFPTCICRAVKRACPKAAPLCKLISMGLFDHSADRVGNNAARGAGHVRSSFQARLLGIGLRGRKTGCEHRGRKQYREPLLHKNPPFPTPWPILRQAHTPGGIQHPA